MEPIRVLLADDVEETRGNIRRILSFDKDLAVVGEAHDGQEAVQKVKALNPDIVLMDVNMPRMTVYPPLKNHARAPGTAVIL